MGWITRSRRQVKAAQEKRRAAVQRGKARKAKEADSRTDYSRLMAAGRQLRALAVKLTRHVPEKYRGDF